MKEKNNIIRITSLMLIIIIMTLSITSCGLKFGGIYDEMFGQNNTPPSNGGNKDEDEDKDEESDGNLSENVPGEGFGGYYPGSGQDSVDEIAPHTKTLLSTVTIVAEFGTAAGAGSGVFYQVDKETGDAYIITNHHVVCTEDYGVANKINVYLYGMELSGYAIPATLLGGSVTYDIAVLKIEGSETIKNSYAIPATIADSDKVRVFDKVYAVGNAEGDGMSATRGIVSVESESLQLSGADGSLISLRVMRFDAAVNHGNSGGGLYNEKGELIGIVSAKDVSSDVDNMGYAIPSDLAKKLADNIIDHCDGNKATQVNKALIGITITAYVSGLEIDEATGSVYQVELVEVIEITPSSLASDKVQVGDIVNSISVDGVEKKVSRMHHVTDSMLDARVGSTVIINITRGEETFDVTIEITEAAITTVK